MIVLYRKYRPQNFSELAGQENVKEMLLSALKQGKVAHAFLFSGPKGTGKTTTARILAKALNCEKSKDNKKFAEPCNECDACLAITRGDFLDVLEIDAASNRGIDDIRELREKIKLAPGLGRFKIYIIDEAHMLTTEAFNALLKTLEEPPAHVVFILCTTEAKKLPVTILSRCQKVEFKKASLREIVFCLEKICRAEKLSYEKEALELIAKNAQGGFRDGVSLLDQVASFNKELTKEIVLSTLTISDESYATRLVSHLINYEEKEALGLVREYLEKGKDTYLLVKDTLNLLEELLLVKFSVIPKNSILEISTADLKKMIKGFLRCEEEMKYAFLTQLPLELLIVEWCIEKNTQDKPKKDLSEVMTDQAIKKVSFEKEKTDEVWQKQKEATSFTEGEFRKNWQEVLKMVRSFNHSLEALLRSCEIEEFSQNTLVLGVFYKFHKDKLMDVKILRILNECMNKVLGQEVKVTIVLKERKKPLFERKEVSSPNLVELANEIFNN